MCIYVINRKKKSLFKNFACKKISYFDNPAVKKVQVWSIFSKISAYLHMQLQINEHLKNISHEKIPFCQYSVKYLCIFYVIQKLNVRKFYILATAIVKSLEFNWFRGIIMDLCNQSHVQKRKKMVYFTNSAAKKWRQKNEFSNFRQSNCFFQKSRS